MKKTFIALVSAFMAFGMGYAQTTEGTVAQPTHVIGRRINSSGEVTMEFASDFSYREDGKLSHYDFPEYAVTIGYTYSGNFITQETVSHRAGHPVFHENNLYTYENGQIKTVSHILDNMGISQYWVYSYYDDGRLERKDYREEDEDDYHMHWLYDYGNDGKTVVESYYTSWVSQGTLLRKKTTSQYDDSFTLQSTNTENYNVSGELTSATQTFYSYTHSGMLETETTQALSEGEWVNSSVTKYTYDETDRVVERLDGIWSAEDGEWDFTHKITFETSEEGQTCIVSFYRKSNDSWVWDVFNNQTILFGSNLKAQQRALSYMVYEEMNGHGNVNQLEFALEGMNEPTYEDTEERPGLSCGVYPNPGKAVVRIEAPAEGAVVRFYDLQGRLIKAKMFDFQANINTEDWPSGIYLWEIWHDNQKTASGKWVKE